MKSSGLRILTVVLATVSALTVLALTPRIWATLDSAMVSQKALFVRQLEQSAGLTLRYRTLSPNILEALEFLDVEISTPEGHTVVKAASVRLRWDWLSLLEGKTDHLISRVQVINGAIELDLQRDEDFLARIRQFLSAPAQEVQLPPIEGFHVALNWRSPTENVTMDRGFFELSREPTNYRLTFRGELAAFFTTKGTLLKSLQGQFDGDLTSNLTLTAFSVQARTSRVTSNLFDLSALHLQLKVNSNEIEVIKVQDSLPFDFRVHYDPRAQQTSMSMTADHFQLSQLVRWKGADLISRLMKTTLTGQFGLQLSSDLRTWSVEASGEAGLPSGLEDVALTSNPSILRGQLSAVPGRVVFRETSWESEGLGVSFDGTLYTDSWLPDGHLVLDHWVDPSYGTVSGFLDLTKSGNTVALSSGMLEWNGLKLEALQGWVEHNGEWLAGSLQAQHRNDGLTTQLVLGGKGSLVTQVFPVTFQVSDLPVTLVEQIAHRLNPATGTLEVPATLQALQLGGRGTVNLSPQGWSILGLEGEFHDPANPARTGRLSADFQNGLFRVMNGQFQWDGLEWTADLQADVRLSGLVSWQLQAGIWGQRFDASGLYSEPDNRLSFSGSRGLAGSLSLNKANGDWQGDLKLDELSLPGGYTAAFDLLAEQRSGQLKVQVTRADIKGFYPWNQEPFTVQTKGQVVGPNLSVSSLSLKDSHNRLSGTLKGNWNTDFQVPWTGELALQGADGSEGITGTWTLKRPGNGTATLSATRVDLARWVAAPFRGRAGLKATATWADGSVDWGLSATVTEARWGESPLGLKFIAEGNNTKASVKQLSVSLDPVAVQDGQIDVDLSTRRWKAELPSTFRFGANRWAATLSNSGTWDNSSTLALSTSIVARKVILSGRSQPDWALNASLVANLWRASLADGSVTVQLDQSGNLAVTSKAPFPIQGTANGQISGGKIHLQIQDDKTDLTLLKDLADKRLLNLTSGSLSGSFLVTGLLSDPEILGKGQVSDLVFDTSYVRKTVGPVKVGLEFKGRSVTIVPSNIGPPGQVWTLSGTASLDHFSPQEYRITLETDSFSTIPYSYLGMGIKAQGVASGLMTMTGNPYSLVIGGRMTALESQVMMSSGSYFPTGGDYFGVSSDLVLVSGRKVEFLFPNENFPVLKAVLATNQTVNIHWNEAANDLAILGKILLKTGELNYLSQTFSLKEGSITFNEDETGIDPLLNVRAELKTRTDSGLVTITLRGEGNLSNFNPRFSSIPYRTPEELQRLVGSTLAVPGDYAQQDGVKTAISLASDVGTSFLLKPFEDSIKKNFNLDLFSVKTELLKKSLLSQNTPLGASDYLDNTRLFFGKYIGDELFLQGSLAFLQNTVPAAGASLLVEPEISLDFQTPFFLLNWTLQPLHPETLFVSDNTVTFKWDWSY